jgi:RHS repeat-associated protein
MNMAYDWTNNVAIDNKYQYNGKEMNDDFGLNLNDYGARWYDAALGRWSSVDPLVDSFPDYSAFNYVKLNPFSFVDMRGDSAWPVTRNWNGSDAENFSKFANNEIRRMQAASEQYDCADLATTILVNYASANGLEVAFTKVDGTTMTSSDDEFSTVDEFNKSVKAETNAKSILSDMSNVWGGGALSQPGDMTNNGFHVNIVTDPAPNTSYDNSEKRIPTASGTLPPRVPSDSSVSSSNTVFKRWNVIHEAFEMKYREGN